MLRKELLAIVAIGIALTGGIAWMTLSPTDEERLARECEAVLKDRLKSPSSYKRLEFSGYEVKKPSLDDYFGWTNPEKKKADKVKKTSKIPSVQKAYDTLEAGHKSEVERFQAGKYLMSSAYLDYEASNSFGALIRGSVECSFISFGEVYDSSGISPTSIRVDGFRAMEWSTYQLKQLGG
jgi:hypothetical protein